MGTEQLVTVCRHTKHFVWQNLLKSLLNPLKPELNSICYLLALLPHHFLHVSRIRVNMAQDRGRWRALLNALMNLRVPSNAWNSLISWGTVNFSTSTLLRGASLELTDSTCHFSGGFKLFCAPNSGTNLDTRRRPVCKSETSAVSAV